MKLTSIVAKLGALTLIVVVGLVATVAMDNYALSRIKINGPLYAQIDIGKDLVGDILPPPEFIIEPFLVSVQMQTAPKETLPSLAQKFAALKGEFETRHGHWKGLLPDGDMKDTLLRGSYDPALKFFDVAEHVFMPALNRGDKAAADGAMRDMTAAYETHRAAIDKVVVLANKMNADLEKRAADDGALLTSLGLAIAGVAALVILVALFVIGRNIAARIGALSTVLVRIEDTGDLSLRANVGGEDEIAMAGKAFDALMAQLNAIIGETAATMSKVAVGDVSVRFTSVVKGDFVALKEAINTSVESLSRTLRGVADNVRQVAAATAQATTAVGQISDGAQSQLNALRQVSIGMVQTSRAVEDVSDSAQKSSQHARDAAQMVVEGGRNVDGMVESVTAIAGNAEQVTKITDVISQIATQTNMLSLNAAIEAARAGEHGRGFDVVAAEVGRLAEHSGRSVQEIVGLVSRAAKETDRGVKMAGEVRGSIGRIADGVAATDRMCSAIAAAIEQQQAAITEIQANVGELTAIGESNASAAEEITATMMEISRVAQTTRQDVERFKFA